MASSSSSRASGHEAKRPRIGTATVDNPTQNIVFNLREQLIVEPAHVCYYDADTDFENPDYYHSVNMMTDCNMCYFVQSNSAGNWERVYPQHFEYLSNCPNRSCVHITWREWIMKYMHDSTSLFNYRWEINGKAWVHPNNYLSDCAWVGYDMFLSQERGHYLNAFNANVQLVARHPALAKLMNEILWLPPHESDNNRWAYNKANCWALSPEGKAALQETDVALEFHGLLEAYMDKCCQRLPFIPYSFWIQTWVRTYGRAYELLLEWHGHCIPPKVLVDLICFYGPNSLSESQWLDIKHYAETIRQLLQFCPAAYLCMPPAMQANMFNVQTLLKYHGHMWHCIPMHMRTYPSLKLLLAVQSFVPLMGYAPIGLANDPRLNAHGVLRRFHSAWSHASKQKIWGGVRLADSG